LNNETQHNTTNDELQIEANTATASLNKKSLKWNSWRDAVDRISYQGLVRNTPYLIFLALLCVLYITNTNKAVFLNREINKKTKELKELKWRYMDVQSRLMYQTSETQLMQKAQQIGLKPLDKPPFEIKVPIKVTK
jgi:cell division protein FtsL